MSIQSTRSAISRARSHEATFQPGTRSRSTPVARAASRTTSASSANRSAFTWQWESTRRIPSSRAGFALRRRRLRGLDLEAREQRLGVGDAAGLVRPGAPLELSKDGRLAVPVGAVAIRETELTEHAWRGSGHDRGDRQPEETARLDEVAEDAPQSVARRLIAALPGLRQIPGLLGIDHPVRCADERPQRRQRIVKLATLNRVGVRVDGLVPGLGERRIALETWRRPHTVDVPVGHGDGAVQQVAEVVGKVGVVATHEGVPGDLCVAIERHFAHYDVPGAIGPERRDEIVRVEEITAALAHALTAAGQQPAV